MRSLAELPKTDLHVHFQGSARAETVRELATRNDVPLPSSLAAGRYAFTDFGDFLLQYSFVCASLQTPEDVRRVAIEICEDEAASGVRYAEVTLTILGYADRGDEIVRAVLDGFAESEHPSARALGFTDDDLTAIARAGVASAFLERDEQQSLTAEIDAWLAAHPDPLQEPSR